MRFDKTPKPVRQPPPAKWKHRPLWERLIALMQDLPDYYESSISVEGIPVTETYAMGEVLGLSIEVEVVRTLNDLRHQWDPDGAYAGYRFVRQAQTFPDVLLRDDQDGAILMGMELKSWYILAKEGEPSFRFTATREACPPQDLFVVVPWFLPSVLSGSPEVLRPYVELSRYIADWRNYWWQDVRAPKGVVTIESPDGVRPYPDPKTQMSDKALGDKGGNFGRIGRVGPMDEYVRALDDMVVAGVTAAKWRRFLKAKNGQ